MSSPSPATTLDPARPLQGRTGLILGLANEHSIAWGIARQAHAQGARLVLGCLNDKAAAHVAPLAAQLGGAPLLQCDVQQAGALEATVAQAAALLGGHFDFVVHAIAWAPLAELHGRVTDSSSAGFAAAMDVSCHSFARLAKLVEPLMPEGGALITISYLGADEAVPHYGLMGPVKAALESLVRYLAVELGPQGIRVHAVSPGPMPTRAASGIAEFDVLMAQARAQSPLRRLVTLDEVGACVAFLASPAASGMSGQTIHVDGGQHAVR